RLVRIEAARILAAAAAAMTDAQRAIYTAARRELDDADRLDLDRPEGWFNRAVLAESESHPTEASRFYQRALDLDPDFVPARANLDRMKGTGRPTRE
ncbi:MAG TPA: tetratricopeptide repeat protein, partial [Kofleriaceae bacterium]|nr:tetratricopeptide repeat protein [Kofleriaceae bacterium]